jgi:RNA polymerase sigma-70 factor, ECF subfamily
VDGAEASSRAEEDALVAAARAGGEPAFAGLFERNRREVHVHCYRMLGSFEDAEDLVQETFLRAGRYHDHFEGRSAFRVWVHRIATNACRNALERRPRLVYLQIGVGGPCSRRARTRVRRVPLDPFLDPIAQTAPLPSGRR